jgi:predicted transposase YbfD/YdcC
MFANVLSCFESLDDPRRECANKLHKLSDIVFIVLVATMVGIEEWDEMEVWGEANEEWLRRFIELPNGIPAHDTLNAVMGRINPKQSNICFTKWVQTELPSLAGIHVAIDGKTVRGSRDADGKAVHIVSAFASEMRVALTQQPCGEKSNEITAIPDLLDFLELQGAIITIDAMGCQTEIAQKIIDAGADYVLALKENQPTLYAEVKNLLDAEDKAERLDLKETIDEKAHGRLEIRTYGLINLKENDFLSKLSQKDKWAGLAAIGMAESIRDVKGVVSKETRYFISSITNIDRFKEVIRGHWSIENSQHHILDVQFGEDQNRTREKSRVANHALVRKAALNLLRCNVQDKLSIRRRKIRAFYNEEYRMEVLFGGKKTA